MNRREQVNISAAVLNCPHCPSRIVLTELEPRIYERFRIRKRLPSGFGGSA